MKFFRQPRNIFLCTLVMVGILSLVIPTHAGVMDTVASIVGNIVAGLVWIAGHVLVVLMYLLIWVASYNDFIKSQAVASGWVILRDVCNMFFIVILLFVAFATVLNIEGYSWKKILPKMLLMAVLINFSKMICGVIIDIAQVVMLTFVNGFRDIGGGNLTDMLGINKLLNISGSETAIDSLNIMGTYVLALAYIIVSTVVIVVILAVLIMRIVMLWILVTLSPLAYFLAALPNTKKYAENWWKQFMDNVISGPILAFFIWLAFTSASADVTSFNNTPMPNPGSNEGKVIEETRPAAGLSSAGSAEGMLKFIISIGMLIGGLMITKELSGMAGKIAGAGISSISKGGKTLSGFNAVNDRVKAFNKQREAARSEKISNFGDRAFGGYLKVKGGIAGTAQGMKETVKTGINKGLDKTGAFGEAVRAPMKNYRDWKEERGKQKKEDRDVKDKRKEAYGTGKYKDPSGREYEEHKDGKKTYYRAERKDEAGNIIPNEYDYATTKDGKKIEKMSDVGYNYNNAWTQAMINSRAYNNKREKGEADKEKEKMMNAGLTTTELLGVLEDVSASDSKRLAASLALAVKEGFKNKGQVSMVQSLLDSKNNNLLNKQFNDDVDKKQAHHNYDIETPEGRIKFAKRREEGKFDVLQASAYEDQHVIQALKESMTDKEFVRHAEKISAYSSKHDTAFQKGITDHLDTLNSPAIDPLTDKIDKARIVGPKITHKLTDGVRGSIDPEEVSEVVGRILDSMSTSDIAKLKPESLKPSLGNDKANNAYNDTLKDVIINFSKADMHNIRRVPDGNRETVDEIYKIWYVANRGKTGNEDLDAPTTGRKRRGSVKSSPSASPSNPSPSHTRPSNAAGPDKNSSTSNEKSADSSNTNNPDIEDAKFEDLPDEDETNSSSD